MSDDGDDGDKSNQIKQECQKRDVNPMDFKVAETQTFLPRVLSSPL